MGWSSGNGTSNGDGNSGILIDVWVIVNINSVVIVEFLDLLKPPNAINEGLCYKEPSRRAGFYIQPIRMIFESEYMNSNSSRSFRACVQIQINRFVGQSRKASKFGLSSVRRTPTTYSSSSCEFKSNRFRLSGCPVLKQSYLMFWKINKCHSRFAAIKIFCPKKCHFQREVHTVYAPIFLQSFYYTDE